MSEKPTATTPKIKPIYMRPKIIALAIASVIFLILIFQNWESVSVDLFFMTDKKVPAALLYIAFSLVGFVVGWLIKRPKSASKSSIKTEK
ncbi:MAG: DUF1049 domain-containing protein [Phycisphaerales bacterium]|nr:DUF1049 domain-containing protein [Phycisphaerales bacterium]